MNKTKVALVIGHDANDQGAYGSKGISEFRFNDELISEMTKDDMLPNNCEYNTFYRNADTRDYTPKMIALHEDIDKWGADVSIEFHFNSFSNKSVHGHEVLYCSRGGKRIAELLNDSLDEHLPTSNRGAKKVVMSNRGGGFCCRGKSLAIILEPYFAAHQYRFIVGGDLREPLKLAISDFLFRL